MVIKTIQEDIFKSEANHIAFAVNVEGFNDAGFAGQVSSQYWNELSYSLHLNNNKNKNLSKVHY